mmetsp:Transcript_33992/g.102664  ORF Transcript_33992/g.102664 Transcript_33992/m.102664 type:complete len:312 (-) Transcript_33992:1000-1935(-)
MIRKWSMITLAARVGQFRNMWPCMSFVSGDESQPVENRRWRRLSGGASSMVSRATVINSPPMLMVRASSALQPLATLSFACMDLLSSSACVAACVADANDATASAAVTRDPGRFSCTFSLRTLSTASIGAFLYQYFLNVGPSSSMSKICMCKEFTELCPNTWKNKPTSSLHVLLFFAYNKAASRMSSNNSTASCMDTPPSDLGIRPNDSTLNHCQCKSLTVRKRCRRDMDALPSHSGSSESQCSSFSGRLQQTMNLSSYGPNRFCSSAMPGCSITPAATLAKTLNGLLPVVSCSDSSSKNPKRISSCFSVA